MWLFRFVQRPNGRYIVTKWVSSASPSLELAGADYRSDVTSSKVASVAMSLICLGYICGFVADTWEVYLNHATQVGSGGWRVLGSVPFAFVDLIL